MSLSRHRIDTSISFSGIDYASLEESREVEDPDADLDSDRGLVLERVSREPYISDKKLIEAVDLAIALGRPLLLQGDPGCGKTRLAYAVAYALGLPLEVSYI